MFGSKVERIEKLAAKRKSGKLIALLRDKDAQVRYAAVAGLGKCRDDDAYNALIGLLRDADAGMRGAAAKALGALGRPSARVHIEHQISAEKDAKLIADMKVALSVLQHGEE